MNKPYFIAFLLSLALWTVIPSVFAGDVVLKVFEGKPRINSPHRRYGMGTPGRNDRIH